ncbi:uncharacterized protein MKZ38_008069 [Zalerion maritima]|uniref:SET domain-containing protein n=1 Tax=Zalerion maritima TaxID=339359 RepID=A0AAD5RHX5_9PEZI|nr:uncharacterized protein MKZ38_008069 [Zalerion maritima]
MPINELPLQALSAWRHLNDVNFCNVKVAPVDGRGTGIVAERALSKTEETPDDGSLMTVPHDLILSSEMVEEYAKENNNFRELFVAVGRKSDRENVLLFLLVQLAISSENHRAGTGISNPWTTYTRFLPPNPPIPTLWSDLERACLKGTSLEHAVTAKLSALSTEFNALKDSSSDLFSWFELFWERGTVSSRDWLLVDALFRSRCLELSNGHSVMVPCVDMANHSFKSPTARFEWNQKGELALFLREGCTVPKGDEITINYGEKSAAEMLFSYGFIDQESAKDGLVLPLNPLPDDPLAKAKLFVFGKAPTVSISRDGQGNVHWLSPFAYLASLNEEDGLEFRVLQETGGSQHLKVFWGEADVTEKPETFKTLIQDHSICEVFKLRAVSIVLDHIESQLAQLGGGVALEGLDPVPPLLRGECIKAASELRDRESRLLESALEVLNEERTQLLANKNVVAYLGSMEATQNDDQSEQTAN